MRSPMNATISNVVLTFGSAGPQNRPVAIPGYKGRPLFMTAKSDGTTLTIDISNTKQSVDPGPPTMKSSIADVTITYVDIDDTNKPSTKQHFTIDPLVFDPPTPLQLKMKVSSNLNDAALIIEEVPLAKTTDIDLTFVLIEGNLPEPRLQLEWIDPPVTIDQGDTRTVASIVPRLKQQGSTLGPMGMGSP